MHFFNTDFSSDRNVDGSKHQETPFLPSSLLGEQCSDPDRFQFSLKSSFRNCALVLPQAPSRSSLRDGCAFVPNAEMQKAGQPHLEKDAIARRSHLALSIFLVFSCSCGSASLKEMRFCLEMSISCASSRTFRNSV